ncbi:menaquinone biosynthesis protein [Leptospira ryugenii]|uniref:Chorismate dehydratase n=1 Tax=Leptospira ryugenii TaxID=1917863 RepID=A0A2P2DWZ3_9LEPT|nr:MqnA/MqnD/SBP family protein [Leptospira ryugenii]GBF49154.1 menaquinone biosynthesis protein [Leptospira ryugenii]
MTSGFLEAGRMRVGIVKHLNARPLTYYFEKNTQYEVTSDHPAKLIGLLQEGILDMALVSSIECERNAHILDYSKVVGVCAKDVVRSVLYFQNKATRPEAEKFIYTDSGSRASVALLQCLFYLEYGFVPSVVPSPADQIERMMEEGFGSHLLFGDHALLHKTQEAYQILDLADWWNKKTQLYFCFAFWAKRKEIQVEESLYLEALSFGMEHIEEIIQNEKRLPTAIVDRYLKQELHFIPEAKNLEGFSLYLKTCREIGILS